MLGKTFIKNMNKSLKIHFGDTNNMTIMDCVRKIKIDSSNCWFLQLSEWQAIYSDAKLGRKAKERNQV